MDKNRCNSYRGSKHETVGRIWAKTVKGRGVCLPDFDYLILAHFNWKRRFHEHLRGKDVLQVEAVRQVDQCNMGRWLASEGLAYAGTPEYEDLVCKHSRFHSIAAATIERAAGLHDNEALKLVAPNSEFERASRQCIAAIMKMRDTIETQS